MFLIACFFNAFLLSDHPPTAQAFKPTPPLNQSQTNDGKASSVNQANHRPVVQNLNITILATTPVGFSLKGTDQDQNDELNYTILTEPVNGEIQINPPTGAVTYTPRTNLYGIWDGDAFTYKATNSKGQDSDVGVVTISSEAPGGETTGGVTTGGQTTSPLPTSTVTIAPGSASESNPKFYEPQVLTVSKGTKVTWINRDSTLHTVTSGSAEGGDSGTLFDSSYLAGGKKFQWTFSYAGAFDYYCTLHPYMKGEVLVK